MKRAIIATLAIAAAGFAEEPIADSDLQTVPDLLRGFNDAELAEARAAVPEREEPPLPEPNPREVVARGVVFEDRNANGKHDAGEPGLAGVSISDGQHVRATNEDGGYQFEVAVGKDKHHRFVCATRPNGFKPTTVFFGRILYNADRVDYEFDFGFVRDEKSASPDFWFIAASDSQFNTIEQMIAIAKDYAQVTSAVGEPAFLTTAGDLTLNGSQFEWDMYDVVRRSSKIPVYEGFGGHDGNFMDPKSTVNFEQRIGPPYYSWDYGGVHFIQFITETGYLPSAAQRRQQAWLQADLQALKSGTPVIAISHYPLEAEWFDRRKEEGVNVICQIGAHWHAVQAGSRHGVPVLISAPARGKDWGAFSRTYRWVRVSPDGVTSQLRVAGQYERLEVVAPGSKTPLGAQPMVVLAYDTATPVESVTCRWTSPKGMAVETKLDPQGDWTWSGEFTPDEPGLWKCELEANAAGGKIWKRSQTVEVQSQQMPVAEPEADFPWILAGESAPRRLSNGPQSPLTPIWVRNTGSVHVLHNTPAVADDRVFVSIGNPNAGAPGAGILCLDVRTGEEIWRADSPMGDMRGPVTVRDGVVYAISGEGWVGAWKSDDGTPIWAKPLKPDYEAGRPLAINNTPPVPTEHGLLCADWRSAQQLLDYATGETIAEFPADVGHYAAFATVADDVMFAVRRGRADAIRVPSGESVWQVEETSRSTSAPIVIGEKLIYSGSSGLRARNVKTGELLWQAGHGNAGYQNAIPVVWDDVVLANGEHPRVFDLETGEPGWRVFCAQDAERFQRSRRQSMGGSSTPVIAGDTAWFGHDDGSLRGVNRAGEVVFEYRVGTPIKTSPVVTGNLVLIHDFAGNLWCFAGSAESAEVINAGRGGNSTRDLLKRLDADVLDQEPSTVVVLVGTNDALNSRKLTPIAEYRENLLKIVQGIRDAGSEVVLVTPPPCVTSLLLTRHDSAAYGDQPPEKRLQAVAGSVREIGATENIVVVDLYSEWADLVNEGSDSLIRNPENSGASDGVHPTAEGYALLAKLVHEAIVDHKLNGTKVICFGDSITVGAYPGLLQQLLAE